MKGHDFRQSSPIFVDLRQSLLIFADVCQKDNASQFDRKKLNSGNGNYFWNYIIQSLPMRDVCLPKKTKQVNLTEKIQFFRKRKLFLIL